MCDVFVWTFCNCFFLLLLMRVILCRKGERKDDHQVPKIVSVNLVRPSMSYSC